MNTPPDATRTPRSRFKSKRVESWARAWIEGIARRAATPLSSHVVETRFGATHVMQTPRVTSAHDVVCFPGWGLPGAFWALSSGLEELAAAGRVHIVDFPGQPGLSSGMPLPYSGEGLAGWGLDLLDGLGLARAHIMGVSVGALVAIRLSARLPDRVDRLVLCAPAGFVLPILGPVGLLAMATYLMGPTRERCARFYRRCVLGRLQRLDRELEAEVDEAFFRLATGFVNRSVPPVWIRDSELEAVDSEAMLLLGEADPVFSPAATARRAHRRLRGLAHVTLLRGHGHALELSPVVKRAAAQFLSASSASSATAR